MFWETANKLLFNSCFDIVESAAGRGNLPKLFAKYINQCNSGDLIFVAIDRIPVSEGIIRDILELHKQCLKSGRHPKLIFTDYWCVVEVLISFSQLAEWSKATGDVLESWMKVRGFINNPPGDYTSRQTLLKSLQDEVISISGGRYVTRERFYTKVLGLLVNNGLGQFSLTDTSCWFNDCSKNRIDSGCKSLCGIPESMSTAGARLLCLFKESLLKNKSYGLKLFYEINGREDFEF